MRWEVAQRQKAANHTADQIAKVYSVPPESVRYYFLAAQEASRKYDIPAKTIVAVMMVESSLNSESVSSVGAVGLMQVRPEIWSGLGYNLLNYKENIFAGTAILREYKNVCGNLDCAIEAYYIGITNQQNERLTTHGRKYRIKVNEAKQLLEGLVL